MNPTDNSTTQTNTNSYIENFDPTQDIDISNIEIIDTSKGDKVDDMDKSGEVFAYVCQNCGFKYEGHELITKCPRCGSSNIIDL